MRIEVWVFICLSPVGWCAGVLAGQSPLKGEQKREFQAHERFFAIQRKTTQLHRIRSDGAAMDSLDLDTSESESFERPKNIRRAKSQGISPTIRDDAELSLKAQVILRLKTTTVVGHIPCLYGRKK